MSETHLGAANSLLLYVPSRVFLLLNKRRVKQPPLPSLPPYCTESSQATLHVRVKGKLEENQLSGSYKPSLADRCGSHSVLVS